MEMRKCTKINTGTLTFMFINMKKINKIKLKNWNIVKRL